MKLRTLATALMTLSVMALPVLAGLYYHAHVSPRIEALATAELALPPTCRDLNQQLHVAMEREYSASAFAASRTDREKGLELCANGAERVGAKFLKTALHDLGLQPRG